MREANANFPTQNRACVCITSALYDRRGESQAQATTAQPPEAMTTQRARPWLEWRFCARARAQCMQSRGFRVALLWHVEFTNCALGARRLPRQSVNSSAKTRAQLRPRIARLSKANVKQPATGLQGYSVRRSQLSQHIYPCPCHDHADSLGFLRRNDSNSH